MYLSKYLLLLEPYAVISNRICPSIYMLKEGVHTFHLDESGFFKFWQKKTKTMIPFPVSDMKSYCIEHTKTPRLDGYLFFMCFPEESPAKKFVYTVWAKVLSCVFLVLTVLVYAILHETRNVFGKLLVNYCAALFLNDAVLTYTQLSLNPSYANCLMRGKYLGVMEPLPYYISIYFSQHSTAISTKYIEIFLLLSLANSTPQF